MNPPDPERLRTQLQRTLPEDARAALGRIIVAAAGAPVYAVGGIVRDLLLGRAIADIDLAIEGDAPDILQRALPAARITTHARFGAASAAAGDTRVDVVMARRETYARPGALPDVTRADIESDLRRRDFSINALALRLDGDAALLDPTDGVADIDRCLIRVLHDASFADDATRIFRALRYAARLGFAIEPHTRRLLDAAIAYVPTVGGDRLRRELELMLAEDAAGAALSSAHDAGVLAAVHHALRWDDRATAALAGASAHGIARDALGFALLAAAATADEASQIAGLLRLSRAAAQAVEGVAALGAHADMLRRPEAKPSGVVVLLDRYPAASVAAFAATSGEPIAAQLALRYLESWRHEKPLLSGRDLQEMGVPAGPSVERGLQLIRASRLDGWTHDIDDERALAARFVKSIRDSAAAAPHEGPHA